MLATHTHTEMRSGFLPDRIVHLHPTRLCNLACLHCYSESGPKEKAALDLETLKRALPLLKAEGYQLVSLSGGEPLVYAPLVPLVDHAHAHGFRVTMITNGLFSNKRMDEAVSRLDGVAISFDGLATTHNRLRGRADAFERSCAALARLADDGRPVAAAISLTREAIPDLPDLADHLVGLGAQALQVRPVALAGRHCGGSSATIPGCVSPARGAARSSAGALRFSSSAEPMATTRRLRGIAGDLCSTGRGRSARPTAGRLGQSSGNHRDRHPQAHRL